MKSNEQIKKKMNRRFETPEEKNFRALLSDYLYEEAHVKYSYEDVEPQLKVHKRWNGIQDEKIRRSLYTDYIEELKEKINRKKQRKGERNMRKRR